ncbi:hypothetical protein M1328_03660 [Patescibacteria group bacterium]|nr:hypothetical protein [Patescibacteria group bacterium]
MTKNNISILIYTQKGDKNIKDCLKSAKELSDNVIFIYPDDNFVETVRQTGINQAKTDWVLILDADERLTKDLANEIRRVTSQTSNKTYYKIPRKNIFGKIKWLQHGGWWPDYQIRLINKKYFVSWPKRIHSTPIVRGKIGYLKSPFLHYFHGDLEKMVQKTIVFEDIESRLLYKSGKTARTTTFFRKYFAELWRRLFKTFGFLDGPFGVIESIYQAFSKTITYLFLYEKRNKGRSV